MRHTAAWVFIVTYVTALCWGTFAYVLKVGHVAHPIMYFLVWDMYCGWSSYSSKFSIVGEGVSGKYYQVEPAPWKPFKPYGKLSRFQYFRETANMARCGALVARNTEHEPFARMFIVEQTWAKKYDLPDAIYEARYGEPKARHEYAVTRLEMDEDGQITRQYSSWLDQQLQFMMADNPRIEQEIRSSRPFFVVEEQNTEGGRYFNNKQRNTIQAVSAQVVD